jgi:hypothetical protein
MRVAVDDDVGVRRPRKALKTREWPVFEEILVDATGTSMYQQDSSCVGVESDVRRQRPEKGLVIVGDVRFCPRK